MYYRYVKKVATLGIKSVEIKCTFCHQPCFTRIKKKVGDHGWLSALGFCICGCQVLMPLVCFIDGFKEVHHYCAYCNKYIGVYKPPFSGAAIAVMVGVPCVFITMALLVIGLVVGFGVWFLTKILNPLLVGYH